MLAPTRSRDTRSQVSSFAVALLFTAGVTLLVACPTQRAGTSATAARPKVVTVQKIKEMLAQSTPPGEIYSAVQSSGTVYRLTPDQQVDLQENQMPNALLSYMQLTYEHAVR